MLSDGIGLNTIKRPCLIERFLLLSLFFLVVLRMTSCALNNHSSADIHMFGTVHFKDSLF